MTTIDVAEKIGHQFCSLDPAQGKRLAGLAVLIAHTAQPPGLYRREAVCDWLLIEEIRKIIEETE
jgi:hypothetical protein